MENKQSSEQQVLSTPELLDTIFSFMDLQNVGSARQVCRKWRSVSDLYLKRRTAVKCAPHFRNNMNCELGIGEDVQEVNFLNTRLEEKPLCELRLSRGQKKSKPLPAPIVSYILDVNWPAGLKNLSLTSTLGNWISFGMVILHKMKTLRSISVSLCEEYETDQVLPLCFKELRDQLQDEKLQNQRLSIFQLTIPASNLHSHELEGKLDSIVPDVFATCPKLTAFVVDVQSLQWKATFKVKKVFKSSQVPVWEGDFIRYCMPSDSDMDPTLLQFFGSMLKAANVVGLRMSLGPEVLSLIESEQSLMDRLKTLVLSDLTARPGLMRSLASTAAFKNVKNLKLSSNLYERSPLEEDFPIDTVAFPSLVTLRLDRTVYRLWVDQKRRGFLMDEWILSNVQKMAPNVQRLIIDVFHPVRSKHRGDYQKVLNLAKSFTQLKHLVLVNSQKDEAWPTRFTRSILNQTEIVSCLKGLTSIAICASRSEFLIEYSRIFVSACMERPLHSVRKMQLYRKASHRERKADPEVINLAQLGVVIPEHVEITVGFWDGLIEKKLLEGPVE